MRIVVTGKEGQVVRSLMERGSRAGHEIVPLGRPELDLAGEADSIVRSVESAEPEILVSAAAFTGVDKAESERELAFAVNERGAGALAQAARLLGIPLVHLSTDYVFEGAKASPYGEEDAVAPTGVYGASKLAGERAVLGEHANSAILRTAWVYSPFGRNFIKTMLRLAGEREEIGVVGDQLGNPTSALDIADGVLAVADNLLSDEDPKLRGVFHMTADGEASWAEFAAAIFAESAVNGGPSARVKAIPTAEYPTPARRPANSRLDCGKLEGVHGVSLPHWRSSLGPVVGRILKNA